MNENPQNFKRNIATCVTQMTKICLQIRLFVYWDCKPKHKTKNILNGYIYANLTLYLHTEERRDTHNWTLLDFSLPYLSKIIVIKRVERKNPFRLICMMINNMCATQ